MKRKPLMVGLSIKRYLLSQHFLLNCKSNYCVSHHNQYQHLYNMISYDSILPQSKTFSCVYEILILPVDYVFSAEYFTTMFATNFYRIDLVVALQWNTGAIQNPYHTHGSFNIDIPLTIIRYFTNHMYNSRFFCSAVRWIDCNYRSGQSYRRPLSY